MLIRNLRRRWCEYMAGDATSEPPAVAEIDDGLSLTYSCATALTTPRARLRLAAF